MKCVASRALRELRATVLVGVAVAGLALAGTLRAAEPESLSGWSTVFELRAGRGPTSSWCDAVLPPAVFTSARLDLGDLRLIDARGRPVPYALRVRRPESGGEPIAARQFNRSVGPEGDSALSLDLGEAEVEHSEVEVALPGRNVRRRVRLDGSNDGREWRELVAKDLFHFEAEGKQLTDRRLEYPPGRFRYLRLRVDRDPEVDKDPVAIGGVWVRRRVESPGEPYSWKAQPGPREPVRDSAGPSSAWVLGLGGDHVPCNRLAVDVPDAEFARNYRIEAGGPEGSDEPFHPVGSGLWRRRADERRGPLVAQFDEVTASRLRLVVIDHDNPPLELRSAVLSAPARQVVFASRDAQAGPLRLYAGNPKADPPEYDFARNLPARLDPPPTRLVLGPGRANPVYRPEPLPLTERWPWLIYGVLGSVAAVLGLIILSLARQAVARHDARMPVGAGSVADADLDGGAAGTPSS